MTNIAGNSVTSSYKGFFTGRTTKTRTAKTVFCGLLKIFFFTFFKNGLKRMFLIKERKKLVLKESFFNIL